MAPGYFEKGGENEGKALRRKLSTVLPANLDTYATPSAAAPLFFLPDNTKWRTHAGVKNLRSAAVGCKIWGGVAVPRVVRSTWIRRQEPRVLFLLPSAGVKFELHVFHPDSPYPNRAAASYGIT